MSNNSEPARGGDDPAEAINFAKLYDEHAEYAARRVDGSFEQAMVSIEVDHFKLPLLVALLEPNWLPASVLEIGCATGELIAGFPVCQGGRRTGVDISPSNIGAAAIRFPDVAFQSGDFRTLDLPRQDCIVLSDILEHVKDDAEFLRDASMLGRYVLVNLPLENNILNWGRNYGPNDVSGHLRKYSHAEGVALFARAGLKILRSRRVWLHATEAEPMRRQLRRQHLGAAYAGQGVTRWLRAAIMNTAHTFPAIGRPLLSSNLFAIAEKLG